MKSETLPSAGPLSLEFSIDPVDVTQHFSITDGGACDLACFNQPAHQLFDVYNVPLPRLREPVASSPSRRHRPVPNTLNRKGQYVISAIPRATLVRFTKHDCMAPIR